MARRLDARTGYIPDRHQLLVTAASVTATLGAAIGSHDLRSHPRRAAPGPRQTGTPTATTCSSPGTLAGAAIAAALMWLVHLLT